MLLYKQTATLLKNRINSDELSVGDLLPTEKQLIEHYKVSRVTLRKAINELVEAGMVEKVQGSGTFVRQKEIRQNLRLLKSGTEIITNSGQQIHNEVLQFSLVIPNADIRARLCLEQTEKAYYIKRLRFIADQPWVYEISWMPLHLFPNLTYEDLMRSKFNYVENKAGLSIQGSHHEFSAEIPDEGVRQYLELEEGVPAIKMTSLNITSDGVPFDYSVIYNCSTAHKIKIDVMRS